MAKPIFYAMTCAVPRLMKLGKTDADKYTDEVKNLSVCGYAGVFGWQEYHQRKCDTEAEIDAHLLSLEKYRLGDTELYMIDDPIFVILPRSGKPRFSMYKCGIKNGDILTFVMNSSVKVKVVGDREVEYCGKNYTLSKLARELCADSGLETSMVYGPMFFLFNGIRLSDMEVYEGKVGSN